MTARSFWRKGKEVERVPSILRLVANFMEGREKIVTRKEKALAWLLIQCVLYAESENAGDDLAEALNLLVEARDNQPGDFN